MEATIYMKFEGDDNKYPYGTYPFDTDVEKNFVNQVAVRLIKERGCEVEVVKRSNRKVGSNVR